MTYLPQTQIEFTKALQVTAKAVTVKTLVLMGAMPATISQAKAYKQYGEENVKLWQKAGLLPGTTKTGMANSRWNYDVVELESCKESQSIRHLLIQAKEK